MVLDGFELLLLLAFLVWLKLKLTSQPSPAPTPSPPTVTPTPPPVTVTLDLPRRFNPCEAITVRGEVLRDSQPLAGVPVTVYASALGRTAALLTLRTDSDGWFNAVAVLGCDRHFTEYYEVQAVVWAEALVDGVTYSSPRIPVTVYVDNCIGPCVGTTVTTLSLPA
jgi:hypothetical protein